MWYSRIWIEKPVKKDIDDSVMKEIIDDISRRYAEKITLEDLSQKFGYNRTYLSGAFKRIIGIGLYDYLTMIRFQHAVWDLATTDNTLTSVSMDNGFAEPKLFNKMFRDHFDLLPAEYRKQIREAGITEEQYFSAGPFLSPDQPDIFDRLTQYMYI